MNERNEVNKNNNDMKHTKTNRLAALLLLAVGVMGCTKEETLPGHTPNTARIPMTISVTDGGYAANDKFAAQSRAVENGYATTFTAGDQIGLLW